ncbi:TIGR03905 family TSCPD domain-containing protein [uncultured Oscillibacter sp.]|uniref:TIGR03905 family TSCPD domain-containing protein n=1 Tax=uncultured Oscillibacter sp. TaxID=876091 RepID=UPI0025E9F90D|nr:TIGR03905 family TSCPD domain-containing protein [uncultured Oscillibacter sp.]
MTYSFRPQGVCSREMRVELSDQGIIENLEVVGGCSGNLQGISALVRGMSAQEAISRIKGIRCGGKPTSCPDQLARGLEQILAQQAQ